MFDAGLDTRNRHGVVRESSSTELRAAAEGIEVAVPDLTANASDNSDAANLIAQLKGELRGEVLDRDHEHYDRARRVWNAMFDDRRPLAVLRCADEADVLAAVRLLADTDYPVAVRGGGHHIAGFGGCDAGFVIDLSRMRRAVADGDRVLVQGGATLHEVDVASAAVGRAVPLGVVSETGVAGLALSGGIGWLTRSHGYTCDNLVGARVVTAAGEVLQAGRDANSDLLWGLRGGGGNFGVVTEFEFRSHPIEPVMVGEAYHLARDERSLEALLRFYRDWTAGLSRHTTVWLAVERVNSDHDLLWPQHSRDLVVSMLACYAGPAQAAEQELAPMTRELRPAASRMRAMPFLKLQHLQDNSGAAAHGMSSYMKGEMLTELTDSAIEGIAHYSLRMPTPSTLFEMGSLGGAMGDAAEDDAAVGLRTAQYIAGFEVMSRDRSSLDGSIAWAQEAWRTLLDASAGGVYLNFSGDDGTQRVLDALGAAEGAKQTRLAELKRTFDPSNFFRINHNIAPGLDAK